MSNRKPLALSIPQMALMSRLLDEAMELDEVGRKRWLATLPADHQELAPILQEALFPKEPHGMRLALEVLPKLASAVELEGLPEASRLQPGAHVGPYELIRLLGAGGMAQVWLARRADGAFKREVALKLPVLTAHRPGQAERFARERDILAALEHPHIARLYDAGIDADGLPYLSMEYVQGESLLDWCDTRQVGITARLELLLQVLDALQYAHERQVIHRDLKPSNILITRDGQVRLLDFGVAKLLAADTAEQAPLTEVHGRALTPDYASPELLQGVPVDDRSDVYSLGVLLYELLTGTRPYKLNNAASMGLLEPAIATVEPAKPSLRSGQPAAAARAMTPEQLTRQLRGDLDAIALKALAKDPAQRYQTVAAMARDLRRYLNGETVEAQSGGYAYRAGKLLLRHKTAVATVAVAVAVILVTIGYTQLHEGRAARMLTAAPSPRLTMVSAAPTEQSVAVLPFVDLSERGDQAYFSDGLTEELLDALAKTPGLRVIARTSSFSFKGKSNDLPTIAGELNVANILEGSVRKSGRRLRVTTHLVRASTGEEIWSDTYDREFSDVFQVQDEIAAAVTRALKLKLAAGGTAVNSRHVANTDAYNEYLIGRQFYRRMTRENEDLAMRAFRKSIELDPEYAAAYAGLALTQNRILIYNDAAAPLREQSLAAADKAIALAPDEADGYAARAELRMFSFWDWTGAQADLKKALAYEPENTEALHKYGNLLGGLGQLPQAIRVLQRTTELDPLSDEAWRDLGFVLELNGQYTAAHAAYRRSEEIRPDSYLVAFAVGTLELLENRADQALMTFRPIKDTSYRLSGIALAEQALGHSNESQQALDELIAREGQEAADQIAEIYARRGDKDEAFAWLDRAFQQHDAGLATTKVDPFLASLHDDARFEAILAKLHLP